MKLPSPEHLWERHESLVLNVFIYALIELKKEKNLPIEEIPLNERLYLYIRRVYHKLPANKKPSSLSLIPNSENPPVEFDDIGKTWTRKKPDFRWTLYNSEETDPLKAYKEYTIECKRLRINGNFINAYVVNGIIRFLSQEYKYGNGTVSGAMIGYIQNMEHKEALERINGAILKTKEFEIPIIKFTKNLQEKDSVKKGNHTLNRKKVNPSIFDLRHIWIEVTGNTMFSSTPRTHLKLF